MPTNLLSNKNKEFNSLTSCTTCIWNFISFLTIPLLTGSLLHNIHASSLPYNNLYYPATYNEDIANMYMIQDKEYNQYRYQAPLTLEELESKESEEGYKDVIKFLAVIRVLDKAIYKLQAIIQCSEFSKNHEFQAKYHYIKAPRLRDGIAKIKLAAVKKAEYSTADDCNAAVVLASYIDYMSNNGAKEDQEKYKKIVGSKMLTFIIEAARKKKHDTRWGNPHKGGLKNNYNGENHDVTINSGGIVPEIFEYSALKFIIENGNKERFDDIKGELTKFHQLNPDTFNLSLQGVLEDINQYLQMEGKAEEEINLYLAEEEFKRTKMNAKIEEKRNQAKRYIQMAKAKQEVKNAKTNSAVYAKQAEAIQLEEQSKLKYIEAQEKDNKLAARQHKIDYEQATREDKLNQKRNEMKERNNKVEAQRVENQRKLRESETALIDANTRLADATANQQKEETKLVKMQISATRERFKSLAGFLSNKKMLGILGVTFIIIYFLYKAIPYTLNALFKPVPDVIKATSLPTTWSAWIKQALFGRKKSKSLRHLMVYNPDVQTFVDEEIESTIKIQKHNKKKKNRKNKLGHDNLLFFGPPGTGKTFLSTQMATLSGMHYVIVDTPAFAAIKDESEAVAKAKEIFRYAKQFKTTVMIIFDEFDAVFAKRASTQEEMKNRRSRDVDTKITNVFLNAVEKMNDPNVKIIGITNLSNIVDPAIQRRFRLQLIDRPTAATIKELLKRYMEDYFYKKGIEVDVTEEDLDKVVKMLDGKTGSHVQGLVSTLQAKAKTIGNNKVTAAQMIRYLKQTNKKQESY